MTGVAVGVSPGLGRSVGRYIPQAFGADSLLEETGFELFVPHGISASPSRRSRARKPDGAPEGSFSVAGPMVRIRLPPAVSQQTFGSSQDDA